MADIRELRKTFAFDEKQGGGDSYKGFSLPLPPPPSPPPLAYLPVFIPLLLSLPPPYLPLFFSVGPRLLSPSFSSFLHFYIFPSCSASSTLLFFFFSFSSSFIDLQERMASAMRDIVMACPGERIIVVSHGAALRNLLCHVLGLTIDHLPVFTVR